MEIRAKTAKALSKPVLLLIHFTMIRKTDRHYRNRSIENNAKSCEH